MTCDFRARHTDFHSLSSWEPRDDAATRGWESQCRSCRPVTMLSRSTVRPRQTSLTMRSLTVLNASRR
jgi:hypothetical protein